MIKIESGIVQYPVLNEKGEKVKQPVMVKTSNGTLVPKTRKSTKKEKIKECLQQSPLFL